MLVGKTALVTGGSRGIGAAIASLFAANGASVMLASRKLDGLQRAAAGMAGTVDVFAANAGDPAAAEACVAATIDRFGGLDILVNNAATAPYAGPVIDVDLPRFDKTVEVNMRGPLVWTQQAWRQRMSGHGGCVLNISSIGAEYFTGPLGVYHATKAALAHLTRSLANELAPLVRVNAIAPGLIRTDFSRTFFESEGDPGAMIPLKRAGEPVDIAHAALFLASDLAGWITGEVLVVDGGSLAARKTRT